MVEEDSRIEKAHLAAWSHGRVQGVNFRAYVASAARALDLTGYVRNLPSGYVVETHAEGDRAKLERLIGQLKTGPPHARVERVDVEWSSYTGRFTDFEIEY